MGASIIDVPDVSDGDATHLPPGSEYKLMESPTLYLIKLADLWMDKMKLKQLPGTKYYLRRLPRGYRVYERARPQNPSTVDKFLYGHPEHRAFTSPNEYFPHLSHLLRNDGRNFGCTCKRCLQGPSKKDGNAIRSDNATKPAAAPRTTASIDTTDPPAPSSITSTESKHLVDDELSPDTIGDLLSHLKQSGELELDIIEDMSMDWLAAQEPVKEWLQKIGSQPSWLPRHGELVLWVRQLPAQCQIQYDISKRAFCIFDQSSCFKGLPIWEAGIVAQVPKEAVAIADLLSETEKQQSITYSGFRIEPLPAPNQEDKSLTKRHTYVPMHHLRPFCLYREILDTIEPQAWHPTIFNTLTVMGTVTVVGNHFFKGKWPTASVYSRGVYIGAEFVQVGDTVRLSTGIGDVLEVSAICIKFSKLDEGEDMDGDVSSHGTRTAILLRGKAFTFSTDRAFRASDGKIAPLGRVRPTSLAEHEDSLYWLHDPTKTYQTSFHGVLGRCFEASAMDLWLPQVPGATSDAHAVHKAGVRGVTEAFEYAHVHDSRIRAGKTRFWAETRLDALDVRSLNGWAAASHDPMWEERRKEGHDAAKVLVNPTPKHMVQLGKTVQRQRAKTQAAGAMAMTAPVSQDVEMIVPDSGGETIDIDMEAPVRETGNKRKRTASAMTAVIDAESDSEREVPGHGASAAAGIGGEEDEDEDELGGGAWEHVSALLKSFGAMPKRHSIVVNVPKKS